jgi:hypothetical protein
MISTKSAHFSLFFDPILHLVQPIYEIPTKTVGDPIQGRQKAARHHPYPKRWDNKRLAEKTKADCIFSGILWT